MRKYDRRISPAIFALLLLGLAAFASAAALDVEGRRLVLVQPPGHCLLDLNGSEKIMASQAMSILRDSGLVLLLLFADCNELTELRQRKKTYLETLGSVSSVADRGGKVITVSVPRARLLLQIKRLHVEGRATLQPTDVANRVLPGVLTYAEPPTFLGLDENDVYDGGVSRGKTSQGQSRTQAHVRAITLLKDTPIHVYLFEEVRQEPHDFAALLNRQRQLTKELIARN